MLLHDTPLLLDWPILNTKYGCVIRSRANAIQHQPQYASILFVLDTGQDLLNLCLTLGRVYRVGRTSVVAVIIRLMLPVNRPKFDRLSALAGQKPVRVITLYFLAPTLAPQGVLDATFRPQHEKTHNTGA
jgi:hypothetical protein